MQPLKEDPVLGHLFLFLRPHLGLSLNKIRCLFVVWEYPSNPATLLRIAIAYVLKTKKKGFRRVKLMPGRKITIFCNLETACDRWRTLREGFATNTLTRSCMSSGWDGLAQGWDQAAIEAHRTMSIEDLPQAILVLRGVFF